MEIDEFIGQENIISNLYNAINSNAVSHAYIFEGPDDIGKSTLANIFAQTLLCKNVNKPCNTCKSCLLFKTNNHPDIKIISSISNILIESTRDIIKDINIKPYYGGKKVYIIEDAQKMTIQSQNSLLKTLEEPPYYVVIILTTNNINALLPTIISRCSIKKFFRNSKLEIEKYISTNYPQYKDNSKLLIALSDGVIGNIKKIITSDFNNTRHIAINTIKKILVGSKNTALDLSKTILEYKDTIDVLLYIMVLLFRDMLILKATKDIEHIINLDYLNELEELSKKTSLEKIYSCIRIIIKAQNDLLANANFSLTIETMNLKINT